jgi:hypothetical protein
MEGKRKVKMNGYLVKITMNLFVEAENEKEAHWAVNDALEKSGLIFQDCVQGEAAEYAES